MRLVDLRHDYIIRQLEQHDWSYVARITGMEIRSLQLHFAQYLPNGRAGPKHSEKSGDIDEFKLWKILQAEKDTPAGLVLWLTWSMGLTAKNIVSLTWDQVDLEKNLIHLPGRRGTADSGSQKNIGKAAPEADGGSPCPALRRVKKTHGRFAGV